MMPGRIHAMKPRKVRNIMPHGIGGRPSKVAVRPDWLVALNFSVEKYCTALTITSSEDSEVLPFNILSANLIPL